MKTIFSGTYNAVPAEVFTHTKFRPSAENIEWARGLCPKVLNKLSALKIEVEIAEVAIGATTTTLSIQPDPSVRMSKFRNIEDDISIAVGAKCRVIVPIPDTTYVGIEIPTKTEQRSGTVRFTGTVKGSYRFLLE